MKKDKFFSVLLAGLILLTVTFSSYIALAQVAYVVNQGTDDVSVIDTSTNMVIATIPVGDGPVRVVFTPDGSKAYVTNNFSDDVSVINTSTHTEIDVDGNPGNGITRIPVGDAPVGIDASPDGTKVYVAHPALNIISVIDTATNTVDLTFIVGAGILGSTPHAPAFTPDGMEVWARGGAVNSINRFDFPGNTSLGIIGGIIGAAERIKFLPDGSFAFVNNICGCCGNLQKISTTTDSVVSTLSFNGAGNGLAIAPDGSAVYAGTQGHCGGGGNQVMKIDPSNNSVTNSLPVDGAPEGFGITPDGSFLYVAIGSAIDEVWVVDTSDLMVTATIAVGIGPADVAVVINQPPVALCQNLTVPADPSCQGSADVNNGSFDPDNDPITLAQSPPGPYSLGTTSVTLTVTDDKGASASCTATVTV